MKAYRISENLEVCRFGQDLRLETGGAKADADVYFATAASVLSTGNCTKADTGDGISVEIADDGSATVVFQDYDDVEVKLDPLEFEVLRVVLKHMIPTLAERGN